MSEFPRLPLFNVLQRVRAAYGETPGLHLTPSQAQRLFEVEPSECAVMLDALVTENFLSRTADGLFLESSTKE